MKDYGKSPRANAAHDYINRAYHADGVEGETYFTRYSMASCYEAGQDSILNVGKVFDRKNVTAGIDESIIVAGMDAMDLCDHDLENYVSGVTPDWDQGMIVGFIYKAMLRAHRRLVDAGE